MRDERPDADHIQVESAEQQDIVGQALHTLAGNADHDAAADLIAQISQDSEQGDASRSLSLARRMHPLVEGTRGRFESQEVPVGARSPPRSQVLDWTLAHAQRDGQARSLLDLPDDPGQPVPRDPIILAGLHHDGAIPVLHSRFDAGKNLLPAHPVADQPTIPGVEPAIAALSDTVI